MTSQIHKSAMSKAIYIPEGKKNIGGIKEGGSLSPVDKKDGAIGLISRLLRFDSLSRKNPDSPPGEPPTTYYGVYIPCEIKKGPDEETLHVYKNKSEALEVVRKYKLGRFKAFQNYQEAVTFALRGAEPNDHHDGTGNSLMGEKPYPFKAPSSQDMVALRKSIEAGLIQTVRDRVWDNPRYLVSSGNTPTILHEGSRYNALHVSAKAMNAEMCNLILTIVGDPAFVQKLYGGDSDEDCCKEFAGILVDRYLNTPDKGLNETPLHFACKFGAEQVVDVLTSFPQCNVEAVNKHGQSAKDVICTRSESGTGETVRRIASLLRQRFYVPVLHCQDESGPPAVGHVFTPAKPPELNTDPLSPQYEIRAFAGPMPAPDAEAFRRRWRTPPRPSRMTNPGNPAYPASPALRLRDMSKGLETRGRNLADEMNVGWKEYWPFLDTFTDLRTTEGLNLLENYLKSKYEIACSYAFSESCRESQHTPDFSISRISLNSQTPTKDVLSPMSELCVALKTCHINDRSFRKKTDPMRQRLCRQPIKLTTLTNGHQSPINHTVSQLLCIERTCQVFAKRIADSLIFSLTTEPEIAGDSLKSEAKHLQHTMFTYMDDERFANINFALIHSRLAQLVVFKLKQLTNELDDVNRLVEFLMKLRFPNDDIFSSDDDRKPSYRGSNRPKLGVVIDTHVRCLASFISEELESDMNQGPSVTEKECSDVWGKASKCRCEWKIEAFQRNSKKNASFRKNRSVLSTSPKTDGLVKRLTFDHDIGDGKQLSSPNRPASIISPGGDAKPTVITIAMDKCQVIQAPAEISEDESPASTSDTEEEAYLTASDYSENEDEIQDASDHAVAEAFIYGEEPTKMDRLVFDAINNVTITPDEYPNVYRWRHTVALYDAREREEWRPAPLTESPPASIQFPSSPLTSLTPTPLTSLTPLGARRRRPDCSTPKRGESTSEGGNVSLQVSTWLRVTGPNSPRAALSRQQLGHNVSFGL